jgi:Flp pilus assembly protein protease CpaA
LPKFSDPVVLATLAGLAAMSAIGAGGLAVAGRVSGLEGLWVSLAGLSVGLALMLPGHLFGATGAGDVKLLAAFGTWLGPVAIATAFVYAALAGGVIALALVVYRRRRRINDNTFAFAPAIALGTMASALGL